MTLLLLRGFAALQALTRSASALLDDAATLVRHTKPDSHERIYGTKPSVSPRTGRPTRSGMRGLLSLGYAVTRWPEWQTGILGVIDRESMRRTVKEAVDPVLVAGDALVNASVRAEKVFDEKWTTADHRLIDAVNTLRGIRRHVPADPEPTPGNVLVDLATRLISHNQGMERALKEGAIAGHGIHEAMTEGYSDQTWEDELNARSGHGRYWLDAVHPDDEPFVFPDDRVMATLYEVSIAVLMLQKGRRAERVKDQLEAILQLPYWRVVSNQEWLAMGGRPEHNPFAFPWMPIESPIPQDLLDGLLAACKDYAVPAAEWEPDGHVPPVAGAARTVVTGTQGKERSDPTQPLVESDNPVSPTFTDSRAARRRVFRKVGSTWEVRDGDLFGVFDDLIGMRYIHTLLGSPNPDNAIAAIDLAGIDPTRAPQSPPTGDVIDVQTKAEYQDRIGQLDREIDEASASKDEKKQELLKRERGDVIRELAAATRKGGRIRLTGSNTPAESARASVKLALNRAYALLRNGKPPLDQLASHLQVSIKTDGPAYAYRPVGTDPMWVLE